MNPLWIYVILPGLVYCFSYKIQQKACWISHGLKSLQKLITLVESIFCVWM